MVKQRQTSTSKIKHKFLFWLGYANSTVNPVLYAVFNVEFRRAFQTIMADFCCRCCPALHRRLTKHRGQRGVTR